MLTHEEADRCVSVEFNPVRAGFAGGSRDVWTRDVLNLGVSPSGVIGQVMDQKSAHRWCLLPFW